MDTSVSTAGKSPEPKMGPRCSEEVRLEQEFKREPGANWKRWGPYLAERQWGTVREDYSHDGKPWWSFPHDHARGRAYRWGEDGLMGITDRQCRLCFAVALWNGKDPILKERLFGVNGDEGNHGEDVKEEYYYLDSTPTHSYMKALYKYPQSEYPYERLVHDNQRRSRTDTELELVDTGVFDRNRYFDVLVEYAKETPNNIVIRLKVVNRGPLWQRCMCCQQSVSKHLDVGLSARRLLAQAEDVTGHGPGGSHEPSDAWRFPVCG